MLQLFKTFLEFAFRNTPQYCGHVPLNIRNIKNQRPFIVVFIFRKNQKSQGAKSGKQGG